MKQQKFASLPLAKRAIQCRDCPPDHKPHVGRIWLDGRWVCERIAYERAMCDAVLARARESLT